MSKFASLFFLLLFPILAFAEESNSGIDVSTYASYYDVDDGDDDVWGPGIGVSVPIWEKQLKFDLRATWYNDVTNDVLADGTLVPLDFGLSWHQNCDRPFDFYVFGGGSVVFADADGRNDLSVDTDDEFGGYAGGGARYDFHETLGVFTNVYYRFATIDYSVSDGSSGEFDADGLNVDIGIVYTF